MALEIVSLRPLACDLTLPHWLPPARGTLRSLRDDFDLSLTGHFDSATDPRLSRKRQTLAPQVPERLESRCVSSAVAQVEVRVGACQGLRSRPNVAL